MRKLFLHLLLIAILLAGTAAPALALEIRSGTRHHISQEETINRDVILTSDSIIIDGRVNGDVYAFGNTVIVNGFIDGNLVAAANTVELKGTVTGSVLSAANSVFVAGSVGGSLLGAAGTLTLDQAGSIARSFMGAADHVEIRGAVERSLTAAAASVRIDGHVGREVEVWAEQVTIGSAAAVAGPIRYHSDREARIDGAARIGEIVRQPLPADWHRNWGEIGPWYRSPWRIGLKFGGFLLAGAAFLALFPGLRSRFPDLLVQKPWQAPLAGFLALIAVPIGAVLLLITVIGIPISLLVILLFPPLIYFGQVLAAWAVGRLLADRIGGLGEQPWPVLFLVGALLTTLAVELPFVGGLIGFALLLYGLGGFGLALVYRRPPAA